VEPIFTGLIATGLSTCLTATLAKNQISAGIIGNTSSLYKALFLMVQFAGHPLLNTSTFIQCKPCQASNQAVQKYIGDWSYYLYHQSLSGIFLLDCYFIQQFVTSLHSKIQFCLGDSFENAANQHLQTEALPSGFHPLQILMTLHNHASRIHCLCLLKLPPQEILKSSGPLVCQIVSDEFFIGCWSCCCCYYCISCLAVLDVSKL